MINFTPLVRSRFLSRLQEHVRYIDYADAVQQGELVWLIEHAALTTMGRRYDFSTVRTYREFAARVPLHTYEDLRPMVMRMVRGEADVLWPGRTRWYAQSSGTSGGRSKYIPITDEALNRNHYQGASDVVSHYLNLNEASRIFAGKALILGGSFASTLEVPQGVHVGDLSATLIQRINPLAGRFRVPHKSIALMADWKEKLPALVNAAIKEDVTNLSGVPSWFLTVLREVLRVTGASSIHEVWPHLEVFFHGGIAFGPYRAQYEQLCDMSRMHFLETYNASEGFFATQSDWSTTAMLLLLDVGVFYEFIPIADCDSDSPRVLPAWEVEAGKTYELVITACNGLWRYRIGDTVTIEQTHPIKIKIAGRTRSFINAFGEELMVHNADAAIAATEQRTGLRVRDYTAAPVYAEGGHRGRHQWVIEFDGEVTDASRFAEILDEQLCAVNSDYAAKRAGNIFLDPLEIIIARPGLFDAYLSQNGGRLGGQRKVPRLCNDRHIIEGVLGVTRVELKRVPR